MAGYCPTCGAAQPTGARFCPICGQPASGQGAPPSPPPAVVPPRRRGRGCLSTLVIIGLLLVLGVVALGSAGGSATGSTTTAPTATSSRIGPTMTGDDWLTTSNTDKMGLSRAMLAALPNCGVTPGRLVQSLDAIYADTTLRSRLVTQATADTLTILGCGTP